MAKRIIPVALLLMALGAAYGQSQFKMLAGPVGSEIRVRWGGANPFPAGGYTLERKDSGDWKQIAGPMKLETDPTKLQQILGANLGSILKAMNAKTVQELPAAMRTQAVWCQVTANAFPELSIAMGTWYVDTGVQPGVAYSYRIKVGGSVAATVDGITLGKELPVTPPGDPKILGGVKVTGVYIEWPRTTDKQVAGAFVYRAEQEAGPYTKLNSIPILMIKAITVGAKDKAGQTAPFTPSYTDLSVEPGKTYSYRIVNMNLLGQESQPTKTMQLLVKDVDHPMAPSRLQAALKDKVVNISWESSTSKDVAGYAIYRGLDPKKVDSKLTAQLLPADAKTYTDPAPTSGSTQWYVVVAVDKAGNESTRDARMSVRIPDLIPPVAPTGVQVALKDGRVTVTWQASKESDIRGYRLCRGTSQQGPFLCVSGALPQPKFEETLPTDMEGEAWYQVSAIDKGDNVSPYSAPAKLALPNTRPPAMAQIEYARSTADAVVAVKWRGGGAADLAGFIVERSESDAPDAKWDALNGGKPFAKTVTELKDTQVIAGHKYFYRVTAIDSAGNKATPSEASGAMVRKTAPPAAPTGLAVRTEPGTAGVIVSWAASQDKDTAYYRVYKASAATGPWDLIAPAVSPDALMVVDAAASSGAVCFYQVTVLDSAGNESDPTVPVSITPK